MLVHEYAHPIDHAAPVVNVGVVHDPLSWVAGKTNESDRAAVAMLLEVGAPAVVVVVGDPAIVVVEPGVVVVVAEPAIVVVVATPAVVVVVAEPAIVVVEPAAVVVVAEPARVVEGSEAGDVVLDTPEPPSPSLGSDDCVSVADDGGSFES